MSNKRQSRREFLKLVSAGTCGAIVHRMLAPAAGLYALARPLEASASTNRVLVIINLSGGCSYNITPPYSGGYLTRNPTVSYTPAQSLQIAADQGLHPSLIGLKTIWDQNTMALVNLVGYPNHNRSHDESTNIMHAAFRNVSAGAEGWGARLTSQMSSVFGGVSLSGTSLFVKGGTNPPRVISDLRTFGESRIFGDDGESMFVRDVRTGNLLDGAAPRNEAEQYSMDSLVRLRGNIDSLTQLGQMQLPVTFPNTGLGRKLEDAARLIAAGPTLNTQVIYTDIGGFDTHSDERSRLAQLLQEVDGAVAKFAECMQVLGRWNDVVVATMTEFTRTMENNSRGTDHGAAGPMLVLGGAVRGGQRGPAPTDVDVAGYEYIRNRHFNFSQVYGELVGWLGFDQNRVFNSPELAPSPYLGLV